jgi:uncharacterized membrane protein
MYRMGNLIKGFPGKPLHPPLTDASIGAYTVGVAMLVAGALGIEEEQMAHGALLAIGFGLIVAVPTALTGLLDWLDLPKSTPARTTATIHMIVMLAATAVFAFTFAVHLDGYDDGTISASAWILGVAAEALLAVGGTIGGALAYVYGIRVLKRSDVAPADAVIPGRVELEAPPRERALPPPD